MKKYQYVMTCNSDDWRTPSKLYNVIVNEKHFIDLFPYCSTFDQYENKSYHHEKLFINPPYSQINTNRFRDYLDLLVKNGNKILLLIPSRTDTKLFQQIMGYGATLWFISGRLHFNDSVKCATFPSVLVSIMPSLFNFHIYNFGDLDYFISLIRRSNY